LKIKKFADKAQIKWRFCKIWGFLGFDGLAFGVRAGLNLQRRALGRLKFAHSASVEAGKFNAQKLKSTKITFPRA